MSPSACSVHTHSTCCDGENSLEEMAQAAFAAGVRYFGASGHSWTESPWDLGCTLPPDAEAYRRELLRLRETFRGRMEVLLGIEQDSCTALPVPDWADYWIGSVHTLHDPKSGRYFCVDYDAEALAEACRDLAGGDFLTLAERYYAAAAAMAARRPTILGHLDLITKFNADGRFFEESSSRYRAAALEALRAADPSATLLEINTGAMARGYRSTPYPVLFLLREWRNLGGRIIFTADAHTVGGILYGYGSAADWARAAGFSSTCLLTLDGPMDCPL